MHMSRKLIGMTLGALACVALAAGTAVAQTEKCTAAKLKTAGKAGAGEEKCNSKADAKGLTAGDIAACEVKPDGKLTSGFSKADTKGPCPGDATTVQGDIDACETAVNTAVNNSGDPRTVSKCDSKIVKAMGKKLAGLLSCDSKEVTKGDQSACRTAVSTKFTTAIGKIDPADCSAGAPNAGALETVIDNCRTDILADIPAGGGGGACAAIVTSNPISGTYRISSVAGPFICTQNSTTAGRAFHTCASAADLSCGGAGNCVQTPWVTLGGLSQATPLNATTTFTVAEGAAPTCEHAACIKCGTLGTCAGLPSCTTSDCNGHLSNQCCSTPGFNLPSLFIAAVNACTRLDQDGSGSGAVNSSMPQSGHNVVKKSADTSHPDGGGAPCAYDNAADADNCATADGDTKGLVFRTVGAAACKTGDPLVGSDCPTDADGIHVRLSTPGLSTTWQTTSSDCMTNGTYHSGTLLTQIQLNAEPSTAGAVGEFLDHNTDGCAIGTFGSQGLSSGSPAGPVSTVGTDAQVPIPYGGTGLRSAAIGIAFSNITGEGDIGFVAITDNSGPTVVATDTCDSVPVNPPVGCPEQ
jgi:hypothetical protein